MFSHILENLLSNILFVIVLNFDNVQKYNVKNCTMCKYHINVIPVLYYLAGILLIIITIRELCLIFNI